MPISIALIGDLVPLEDGSKRSERSWELLFWSRLEHGRWRMYRLFRKLEGCFLHVCIAFFSVHNLSFSPMDVEPRRREECQQRLFETLPGFVAQLRESPSLSCGFGRGYSHHRLLLVSGGLREHLLYYNYFFIGLTLTAFGVGAVISGRLAGKLAPRTGRVNILSIGLFTAALADVILSGIKSSAFPLILGVALLGTGFMFAHSTLVTIASEFARTARGAAMSLVAFCFMGGGGIGTAIGSKVVDLLGYPGFFLFYGGLLFALMIASRLAMNEVGDCQFAPSTDWIERVSDPENSEKKDRTMNPKLSAALRKWWKWAMIVAVISAVGYKVRFASVPVTTGPVVVGEVVAEVMGTGTLEAHHQTALGAKNQGLFIEAARGSE